MLIYETSKNLLWTNLQCEENLSVMLGLKERYNFASSCVTGSLYK